jgi:ubiquitin carboxyl-terminal hydrolase L3
VLENFAELEGAHSTVAVKGDSAVPDSAEQEVDFHYICCVRSEVNGHLYELDGDYKGPLDTDVILGSEEDILCPQGIKVIKEYISQEEDNISFNLMALVHRGD